MTALFYETLAAASRESLFAEMRRIDAQAQNYLNRGRATRPGTWVETGGGLFEYTLKGEVLNSYLRALRKGQDPAGAYAQAQADRTAYVQSWNAKRGKDYQTHRDLMAEQTLLDSAHRSIMSAINGATP